MKNSCYSGQGKVGGAERGTPTPGTDENLGIGVEIINRILGPPNFSVRTVGLVGDRTLFALAAIIKR